MNCAQISACQTRHDRDELKTAGGNYTLTARKYFAVTIASMLYRASASIALIAAVIVVGIAILSVTETRPADACFVQVNPAPLPNMVAGPDCVWRFADGTTMPQESSYTTHLRSILLLSALAIVVSVLVALSARRSPPVKGETFWL